MNMMKIIKIMQMSREEIDFIINALEFACENGYSQDKEWQKKADTIANKLLEKKDDFMSKSKRVI